MFLPSFLRSLRHYISFLGRFQSKATGKALRSHKKTRPLQGGPVCLCASKPVSRVLSFKTAIYLGALLPTRSSRLPGTVGPTYVSLHGVAPDRVYSDGRFHAIGRALTSAFPPLPVGGPKPSDRRSISVALFLGSPPAGVTRYPCPAEPGLSSRAGFSTRPRGCPAYLRRLLYPI